MLLEVISFLSLLLNASGIPFNLRIVNGTDARPGEFPFVVSLRVADRHFCGGSILNENFILTAAHCVQYNVSYYSIQYGLTYISSGQKAPNIVKVSKVIPHEGYVPNNGYINDIAVVKLVEPLVFSSTVQPVNLPIAYNSTPGYSPALLVGWGAEQTGGGVVKHLQKVHIFVYPDDACEKIHKYTGPTNRKYHICAGVPEGGKGQCSGDSGGPLLVNNIQVGTVSWSVKPCTIKGYPGVFAKVANYVAWINEKISRN